MKANLNVASHSQPITTQRVRVDSVKGVVYGAPWPEPPGGTSLTRARRARHSLSYQQNNVHRARRSGTIKHKHTVSKEGEMFSGDSGEFGTRDNTKQRGEKVWNRRACKGQNGRMKRGNRVCGSALRREKKENDWECARLCAEVRIFLMEYRWQCADQ